MVFPRRRLNHCIFFSAFMLTAFLLTGLTAYPEEAATAAERRNRPEKPGDSVSAPRLLEAVRQPFSMDGWAQFTGYLVHKSETARRRENVKLALRFKPSGVKAKIVFANGGGYWIESEYAGFSQNVNDDESGGRVTPTEDPAPPIKLDQFRVRPQDITFSFLHWPFHEEHAGENFRGLNCRVIDLMHPAGNVMVRMWVSQKYRSPVKVEWFKTGNGKSPFRRMEFTEFKKHQNFWFVKTVNYYGNGWQTKLVLKRAALHRVSEKPCPENLFQRIEPGVHTKHGQPANRR